MQEIATMLNDLTKKKQRLDELAKQSDELAEAIQLAQDYQSLQHEIVERCRGSQPAYIPIYPIYPAANPPYPGVWGNSQLITLEWTPATGTAVIAEEKGNNL